MQEGPLKRILDHYEEATRGMAIKSKSIFRDYKAPNLNVLDVIKWNTEVFDKEETSIDQSIGMRVGDSIKLPPTDFKVVSYSKDNNSIALISKDGKQKYIKPLDDFIAAAQKLEKRQERKQRREDWENSMEIEASAGTDRQTKITNLCLFALSKTTILRK